MKLIHVILILMFSIIQLSMPICVSKLQKCSIYYNMKSIETNLNYNVTSFGPTNDINECCENCINSKDECSLFAYFDDSKYCLLFTEIIFSDIIESLVENQGTNFGFSN
jgi:hypothetical protein